jgi:hypothetical protein
MSKLSETSTELFVRLAAMLSLRATYGTAARSSGLQEKKREYIDRRTEFHALEAEIMASYRTSEIMAGYYVLDAKAKELFDLVQAPATSREEYEPIQNDFTNIRKELFGRMIVEMKLLTWRERRALRKNPTWSIEDNSGPTGMD